jgi:hypothetical protein
MEQLKVRIKGVTPLIMHADTGSNPLHPLTKAHKLLTSKRKKTDDDLEAIALSEWRMALYFDEKIGPYIPAANLEATLTESFKLQKLGRKAKQAILVVEEKLPLIYRGPKKIEELSQKSEFIDMRSVRVQQARLQRCRPIFLEWGCEATISINTEIINIDELKKALNDAGSLIGLCDFRPRHGRFMVEFC